MSVPLVALLSLRALFEDGVSLEISYVNGGENSMFGKAAYNEAPDIWAQHRLSILAQPKAVLLHILSKQKHEPTWEYHSGEPYQSPLPLPSPLALRGSRLGACPAAADANDGGCEDGILIEIVRDSECGSVSIEMVSSRAVRKGFKKYRGLLVLVCEVGWADGRSEGVRKSVGDGW